MKFILFILLDAFFSASQLEQIAASLVAILAIIPTLLTTFNFLLLHKVRHAQKEHYAKQEQHLERVKNAPKHVHARASDSGSVDSSDLPAVQSQSLAGQNDVPTTDSMRRRHTTHHNDLQDPATDDESGNL